MTLTLGVKTSFTQIDYNHRNFQSLKCPHICLLQEKNAKKLTKQNAVIFHSSLVTSLLETMCRRKPVFLCCVLKVFAKLQHFYKHPPPLSYINGKSNYFFTWVLIEVSFSFWEKRQFFPHSVSNHYREPFSAMPVIDNIFRSLAFNHCAQLRGSQIS